MPKAFWRGPALAGIDGRTLRAAAARLDDRRLAVVEASVELRLAAGDAAALAVELPAMVADHPLRDTLRRQLMVALHRCGRRADPAGRWCDLCRAPSTVDRARPAAALRS